MKRYFTLLLATVLALSACNNNLADRVPDTVPNVGTAYINGLRVGDMPGTAVAPAAQMYDPNNDTLLSDDLVSVEVTASDERQIYEVALILSQGEEDAFGDIVYTETWNDILTLADDEAVFKNPFVFEVPFEGANSGLVPARLEIVAKDNAGQINNEFFTEILVDGSLPIFDVLIPETPQSGTFGISAFVSDPESGILEFGAFIDGEEVEDNDETLFTGTSFSTTIDAEEIGNGTHFLTLYAVNGVNELAVESYPILVFKNVAPLAGDDTATTDAGVSVTIDVLANDTDEDGEALTITSVSTPSHGTAEVLGGALIEYTPDAGFQGTDTFFYTVQDTNGAVDSGQVSVEVQDPDAPAAP